MTYCVVATPAGWQVALLHGTLKQPEPGVYRRVRDACREATRRNAALEATSATLTAGEAA